MKTTQKTYSNNTKTTRNLKIKRLNFEITTNFKNGKHEFM